MVDQCGTSQPRAVRELEVVDLREDDLDGEAVDLRAEQAVSRVDGVTRGLSDGRVDGVEAARHRVHAIAATTPLP